jgi:hypothetical protein
MKKLLVTLLILGVIGVGGYYGFKWYKGRQEKQIAQLEEKIHFLKEVTTPIRFLILEKDSAQITFVIKFLDQDNTEFAKDTISIQGQELSFDFYVVPVKDTIGREVKVAFPYKVFTNSIAPEDGISLFKYYDDQGFPQVFLSSSIKDTAYVRLMSELFTKVKNKDTEDIKGVFGSMVQDIRYQNEFEPGKAYEIIVHTKGGIEIKDFN